MTSQLADLGGCLRDISLSPPPVRLEEAITRVAHMDFAPAERLRFNRTNMRLQQTEEWHPTGFKSYEDVVSHELAPFAQTNITQAMLERARQCCPHCERVTIHSGRLSFDRGMGGKMAATSALIRRLHAQRRLPDLVAYISDHDIAYPINEPAAMRKFCANAGNVSGLLPPIFVHASRTSWRGPIAAPDNTFFQAYGGNSASWDHTRAELLRAGRDARWGTRSDRIFFRGSGSGYRKFLNYSAAGVVALDGTDIVHSGPPRCASMPSQRCAPFVPMAKACEHRYLLHLPGTWPGFSNRLKWLMACGAAVVVPQNDWYEWCAACISFIMLPDVCCMSSLAHALPCISDTTAPIRRDVSSTAVVLGPTSYVVHATSYFSPHELTSCAPAPHLHILIPLFKSPRPTFYPLFPTPYFLLPTPYSLPPTPYSPPLAGGTCCWNRSRHSCRALIWP